MRIKICGIKRVEDAIMAAYCGADAIGLVVGQKHNSDDFIDKDLAQKIVKECPPYISPVLVTELDDAEEISNLAHKIGVTSIQLHSDCTVDSIISLRKILPHIKIIKNFHVNGFEVIQAMKPFESVVDAFILDTLDLANDKVGGTGLVHDWNISRSIVKKISKPVLLAGGLTPENVGEAIRFVKPFGVDASSGLKDCDGFKDEIKLINFICSAKYEFFKVRDPSLKN
ncbi:phosphoribosylanthranilate isomerase [Methanosarcina sp. MSH10X1]|uniref:phosphoribosylanthranilate isomerase n=1 Tax=Methanosarcina sp. MSH10X1 TaxID=2507075 RepID=UPI001F0C2F83|nr:phosphoribosylanthranilate isomerase [Methanosarcina sp. MSH10X1]